MTEWDQLQSSEGVVCLVNFWWELTLDINTAEVITRDYVKRGWHRHQCPCTSTGLLMWTKSRLMERGLFPALAVVIREETAIAGVPDDRPPSGYTDFRSLEEATHIYQEMLRRQYARSSFSRSILSVMEPIDRVAQRVTGIEDHKRCRECGMFFRNAAAHRIHLVESHGTRFQKGN